jgi:lactoylglutathione lyase
MFKLLTILFLTSIFLTPTLTCSPAEIVAKSTHHKRQTASGTPLYPTFTIASDPPAPPATLGFRLAHIALFVNDLTTTKHFYGDILGMREIFRIDATADYSVMYMGHAQGGLNGTGFMEGSEMMRELYNLGGLVEFICPRVCFSLPLLYHPILLFSRYLC